MGIISNLSARIESRGAWAVDDDRWYAPIGSIRKSATGLDVTEYTALAFSAVYACVRLISETIASLPLFLFRKTQEGKERAESNPLYTLMHDQPNPEISSMLYRETCMMHLLLYGNSYSEIVWDGAQRPKALWPITPSRVTPRRVHGAIIYEVMLPDGKQTLIQREDMLHIPGLGFNGLVGMSPMEHFREIIGLGLATQEYGARFFGNNARPAGVLEHPAKLGQEAAERLRTSWEAMHKGLSNSHRVAILEEGMKFHEIAISQEAAQYLQTRQFQIEEVCRIYGVPPHLIGAVDKAFTNIEQQNTEFVTLTIRPWLVRIEQIYNAALLTNTTRRSFFFEHSVDALLRGDIGTRYNAYAIARQQGWMNVNEIRAKENMNAIPNGDIYLQPLNMVEAGKQQDVNPHAIKAPGDVKKNIVENKSDTWKQGRTVEYRTMDQPSDSSKKEFQKAFQRIVEDEVRSIGKAADKWLKQRNAADFMEFLATFYAGQKEIVVNTLRPLIDQHAKAFHSLATDIIGADSLMMADIEKFAAEYLKTLAFRYARKGQAEIEQIVKNTTPEDVLDAVKARCSEWLETRAEKNADNESVRLQNAVACETWRMNGIEKIKWHTRGADVCPYCAKMAGKVVGIQENFLNAGDVIYAEPDQKVTDPNDPNYGKGYSALKVYSSKKHPPIHKGCKCTIAPVP